MKKSLILTVLVAAWAVTASAQTKTLDIYFIDPEGGAAALIVLPSGQSVLADAGNPGERDAARIFDAARAAGLKKIDYLVTSHFHADHVGGAEPLTKLIPIEHFVDHGDSVEGTTADLWKTYAAAAAGKRRSVKAGEKISLDNGVELDIVSSGGQVLKTAMKGGGQANPACEGAATKPVDNGENGQSVGFVLSYGKFRYVNLGDLTYTHEMELACPANLIGTVNLFQATHHGFVGDSGAPAQVMALRPQVVVIENGAMKGLRAPAYEEIQKIPGIEGIWQSHVAVGVADGHNTDEKRIANPDAAADKGFWIKASVAADGTMTITNNRNQHNEVYKAR